MINFTKRKYGKIDGVIHAAGSPPLNVLNRNFANIKDSIRAKVLGAENLLNALKNSSLKFFVMTSSLASLIGDVGRIEYCAANSYLDTLSGFDADNICHLMSLNVN